MIATTEIVLDALTPLPSVAVAVIVASPSAMAVTFPESSTYATEASLDDHSHVVFVASNGS